MLSFDNISYQIKQFSIPDLDRLGCMTARFYSNPISAIPLNEHFLGEKKKSAKYQIDISKREELVRLYTDKLTDRWAWLKQLSSSC